MRIVINAISMETIAELQEVLEAFPVEDGEILQMQVNRVKKLGSYHCRRRRIRCGSAHLRSGREKQALWTK